MSPVTRSLFAAAAILSCAAPLPAQSDITGSSDHPLFPRIEGFVIYSYRSGEPDVHAFRNGQGAARDTIEGRVTRFGYGRRRDATGQPPTALAVQRFYRGIVQQHSGSVLFTTQYGELSGRFVRDGREYWIELVPQSLTEFQINVADRPAPAGLAVTPSGAAQPAAAPASCPCANQAGAQAGRPVMPAGGFPLAGAGPRRFTVVTPSEPTIYPTRGIRFSAATIAGPGTENVTEVRFGDYPARILESDGPGIRVVVPALPAGESQVTLVTPAGNVTLRRPFTVYQYPITDGGSDLIRVGGCRGPASQEIRFGDATPDPINVGSILTITGAGLDNVERVEFTYTMTPAQADLIRRQSASLAGMPAAMRRDTAMMGAGILDFDAVPIDQSESQLTVRVPMGARTGIVALLGPNPNTYGFSERACEQSLEPVNIRPAPAAR